jgi:hypothetical protein
VKKEITNYKVLENRLPLTKEQVNAGMDFNKIKVRAAAEHKKPSRLKKFIRGSAIILIVAVSLYLLNRNQPGPTANDFSAGNDTTGISTPIKEPVKNNTPFVPDKKENIKQKEIKSEPLKPEIENRTIEQKDSAVSAKSETPGIDSAATSKKENEKTPSPHFVIPENAKYVCRILKAGEFCNVSKEINLPVSIHCQCDYTFEGCEEVGNKKNQKVIYLSIPVSKRTGVIIQHQLKNIFLAATQSDTATPCRGVYFFDRTDRQSQKQYVLTSVNMEMPALTAYFYKRVDMLIVFENASKGDHVIISNFINAVIQE